MPIWNNFIPLYYFKDIKDVYYKFLNFVNFYNNERVHSSLKYRAPTEVYKACQNGEIFDDIKAPNI